MKRPHPLPLFAAAALLSLLAAAAPARAEIIELVDKTKINGKIVHFYDDVFTVETGGKMIKLPREKVRSIAFALPAARPEFSSAEKTLSSRSPTDVPCSAERGASSNPNW